MRRSPRVPLICLALILAASGCGRDPVGELVVQLQSPAVEARRSAARELAKIDAIDDRAIAALAEALADGDPEVRRLSAIALGHAGSPAMRQVSALQPLLKDARPQIQRAAALAIMRIDPQNPSYIPVLTEELAAADGRLMLEVGRLGVAGAWAVPTLVKLLSHDSEKVPRPRRPNPRQPRPRRRLGTSRPPTHR